MNGPWLGQVDGTRSLHLVSRELLWSEEYNRESTDDTDNGDVEDDDDGKKLTIFRNISGHFHHF